MTATSMSRRVVLLLLLLLQATATKAATEAQAEAHAGSIVVDRRGLAFANPAAFCAVHCSTAWRRERALSECSAARCPAYHEPATRRRRRLGGDDAKVHAAATADAADDATSVVRTKAPRVERVTMLSCGHATSTAAASSPALAFAIDADARNDREEQRNVFAGFYEAFVGAFDAMLASPNATLDACRLQLLQDELLPTVSNATDGDDKEPVGQGTTHRPTLVQLAPETNQRQCVTAIREIWGEDDESMTPFLTRAGQARARATVMLVHVNTTIAGRLHALACVDRVVELPAILKLLPFARSAWQLSRRGDVTVAPAMEIRVIRGGDVDGVLARLQRALATLDGVTNAFAPPVDARVHPRSLFLRPLEQLELWAHAVALAVADDEVEWVDARAEISVHTLRDRRYAELLGLDRVLHPHERRRLDEYVTSLVGVEPAQQRGIRGDDIIVGITDSGLYVDHDQFDQPNRDIFDKPNKDARKVVYYNAWANRYDEAEEVTCGHGTHVAGLLAGSSLSKQTKNIGIADNAKIAFMDIGAQSPNCAGQPKCPVSLATPAEAAQLLQSQIDVGAKIFSFSWGTPGSDYSAQARDLDEFIYNNPEILVVIAAGNSGEESANGQGTISSPSGAKNVISVGASLNDPASFTKYPCPNVLNPMTVASFSSAGPTTDGRLKPDVVAPGMSLLSSQSERPGSTIKSTAMCSLQGTSQATPVVTGMAVLLSQWLRDGWWKNGKKDPEFGMKKIPAALLKALIIHSSDSLLRRMGPLPTGAVSCGGIERLAFPITYPDVYQGYGKPNMSNIADFANPDPTTAPSLYFLPNSTAGSEPRVANQKEVKISFTVPRGVDLRATLVWTDPPGSTRATRQLQHDLDLSVRIRNTNRTFYPVTADNSTKRDEKNNVEMVQVSYQQLVEALKNEADKGASLIGPDGEIVVDAVIFGQSVLSADSQPFAFVASSNSIGTSSGSAPNTSQGSSDGSKSFWTPWTIGGVGLGALALLILIASLVKCCTRRHDTTRSSVPPGLAASQRGPYQPHGTPARPGRPPMERCPHCPFATADPVVMVDHVEAVHSGGFFVDRPPRHGTNNNFGLPPVVDAMPPPGYGRHTGHGSAQYPPPPGPGYVHQVGHHVAGARPDERCPYCSFASADPVLLVNHVQHVHGQ